MRRGCEPRSRTAHSKSSLHLNGKRGGVNRPIMYAVAFAVTASYATCTIAPAQQIAQATPRPSPKDVIIVRHGPPLAPADEYFGPLKMSILGIRNYIRDLGLRYLADPTKANSIFGMTVQTELSLKDWGRRYPSDSGVARQIYFLE